jgi:shikimate 5-dehydrogenase
MMPEITGSVNTLFLDTKDTVTGENTDVYGLQAAYLNGIENAMNKKSISHWSRAVYLHL